MQIGFVGLGKMGLNMVKRLAGDGHKLAAYDRQPEAVREAEAIGAQGASSLASLVALLQRARAAASGG
jgi:6-phosphogluconate dehydrogenase